MERSCSGSISSPCFIGRREGRNMRDGDALIEVFFSLPPFFLRSPQVKKKAEEKGKKPLHKKAIMYHTSSSSAWKKRRRRQRKCPLTPPPFQKR